MLPMQVLSSHCDVTDRLPRHQFAAAWMSLHSPPVALGKEKKSMRLHYFGK
jgi:hypothetical protein